tara:strand:+ start:168 stop:398 length:231 start_codon:yes stop_codon:yes gene_type:complete
MNYDDWKLASPPENRDVSPCCGADYSDKIDKDGYDTYECDDCNEEFSDFLDEREYNNQMEDSIAEDRSDEARDMGK